MRITVSRNGQQFGPYTVEQANAYLATGQLLYSDLAFQEGSPHWVPLGTILGVTAPPPPPLPPLTHGRRNVAKLILMAIVWLLAFWFGSLFIVGAVAGMLNPEDAENAGGAAGAALSAPLFLAALGISVWLTIAGNLPGTRKGQ